MARIRYEKTRQTGVLQSVKGYQHPNSGARYKIVLKTEAGEWIVIDEISGLAARTGWVKDLHQMKIEAREALKQLGVTLEVESRKKRLPQQAA